MRLLVVEDEPQLQQQLVEQLQGEGYVVDVAGDGQEGLYQLSEYEYDLAVVDIGLPVFDGIELTRRLREQGVAIPVLMLTARGDWQDKVAGLESGADDYLTKPFNSEELKARINALLRRAAGHSSALLCFDYLSLDTRAKTVTAHGELLELTSYEYKTLEYLMLHAGKVISKATLTEHLYAQDFDRDSNVIEVFVRRLRRKLDPDNQTRPIATVRGQGYRFALEQKA